MRPEKDFQACSEFIYDPKARIGPHITRLYTLFISPGYIGYARQVKTYVTRIGYITRLYEDQYAPQVRLKKQQRIFFDNFSIVWVRLHEHFLGLKRFPVRCE